MKNQIVYLASIALMASGMAVAQSGSQGSGTMDSQTGSSTASAPQTGSHTDSRGDLPAAKEGEPQSGKTSQADPDSERPGSMGASQTPNAGATPKGETPATGSQTEQQGASKDTNARPGTEPTPSTDKSNSSPKNMSSSDSAPVPSYAKPIGSTTDTTNSMAPQQGTDNGTASTTK